MKILCLFFSIVLAMLLALEDALWAGQEVMPPSPSLKNIALGKPYTLDPQPNYPYCNGPDVTKQLTDGQYTSGYFWTQKSTVGWSGKYAIINLDLGSVHSIRGVSYNTAAGVAGVQWPSGVYIFVSDDGKYFFEAGELVTLSSKGSPGTDLEGGYQVHRYQTVVLSTHGRYLSLIILGEPFIFVDEIEVFEGEPSYLGLPFKGNPISDLKAFVPQKRMNHAVTSRLRDDILAIRSILNSRTILQEARDAISARIDSAGQELLNPSNVEYDKDFRAVIPLNSLHGRIFNIQAQLWKAIGFPQLSVWQSGLWDPLQPIHIPSLGPAPSVQVDMMLNEYRAGAFNLSNTSDKAALVRMEIHGLPGGSNPPYVTPHEVQWTGTSGGYCFPSALSEAEKKDGTFLIHVPSGLTRQVWFTFHPTDVQPGTYQGRILLSNGEEPIEVPLILHIYPLWFPHQPTLHLGGWDYTNGDRSYDITPQNRDKAIAHMREHFVDSPWATSSVLPFESLGKNGDYQPDTSHFDTWMQRWPAARQYCVFMDVGNQLSGSAMGTPEFTEKVKQWITYWAKHAQLSGLRADQLKLLLVDEPSTLEQDEVILQWARAIRAAGTGVKIWEDPVHKDPFKANQEMMDSCDVLCPNRWLLIDTHPDLRAYFIRRQKEGMKLALYSCKGPARELDPYTYYRLQAWSCWQYGALGSYFWSFGDAGKGSSWNEYAAEGKGYTPFFLDAASVTPSKHMEAIREGVEDYEYLVMLRQSEILMARNGFRPDMLNNVRELLNKDSKDVCGIRGLDSYRWRTEQDRTAADRVRIKVLKALTELQNPQHTESSALTRGCN